MPKGMVRWIATIMLMIVPLLLAIALRYWPSHSSNGFPEILRVLVLEPKVIGPDHHRDLAAAFPETIRKHCEQIGGPIVLTPPAASDSPTDALLQSVLTFDAGLVEVDLQLVSAETHKILWRNSYQGKQNQYMELLKLAAQGFMRALRP